MGPPSGRDRTLFDRTWFENRTLFENVKLTLLGPVACGAWLPLARTRRSRPSRAATRSARHARSAPAAPRRPRDPLAGADPGHGDRDPRSRRHQGPHAARTGRGAGRRPGQRLLVRRRQGRGAHPRLRRPRRARRWRSAETAARSGDREPTVPTLRDLRPRRSWRRSASSGARRSRCSSRPSSTPGSRPSCRSRERAHRTRCATGSGSAGRSPRWG